MRAVPDIPSPRPSLEDLRGLSDDLDVLVRAVRDLVALQDEIDAGLGRREGVRSAVVLRPGEAERERDPGAVA
ncbi:hypothetical protein ACQPX6_09830 [Actinomycetospora sp. CA-101289]|uniref:hypothetical protein n=1 Tax=Actinomycetospora sp. CA-101289 TaxID=3239893 RepID=UPI003D984199